MLIATPATRLLGIRHPVLLAPMDLVADARLTAAVSAAGGLGILGGGDGDEEWLRRELDLLQHSGARFGVGFITWSLAKNPKLLDLALERKPTAVMLSSGDPAQFSEKVKRADSVLHLSGSVIGLCKEALRCGADILVAQGTEGGGHGASRGLLFACPGNGRCS